jgi:diaminopimelate epimerase
MTLVMTRTLQKWNGAGNDFLVDVGASDELAVWTASRATSVCDRNAGIGADGLLLATLDGDSLTMTLFNADGSIAEMSGNGIRCLVAAVHRRTKATWSSVVVATGAGRRTVSLTLEGNEGFGSVDMGSVRLEQPLEGTLGVANVGNPHVVLMDEPTWSDAERTARAVALSDSVGGANIEFVTLLSESHVAIKVHERGVGWTQACGTGSVAKTAVLHHLGLTGPKVVVSNPGGDLTVELTGHEATLAGPVAFERDVEWSLA